VEYNLPCEVRCRSGGREILRLLKNPKIYYHVYNNFPVEPILRQLTSNFFTVCFENITHFRLGL
jgi:hypothetical protein